MRSPTAYARAGLLVLAGLLACSALLAGGVSAASRSHAATVTIKVTILDTRIALSKKTAVAGKVVFVVKNAGKKLHTFTVGGKKTPVLKPKKQTKLIVTFTKAGSFPYGSTLAADRKVKGLKGVFKVTAPKPATPGDPVAGKSVFTSAGGCNACHTLKEAGAQGTIGPNLDTVSLPFATIVSVVTNGKNGSAGSMPPLKGTLSTTQIQDVAAFVYAAEHP
jgi:cytochrome c6